MSASFDENGVQIAWNASSISVAETCLRKYQLSILEEWVAKDRSVHLKFGGHFATALEHFHKRIAFGESREDALIAVVTEALIDTWDHDLDAEGNRIPETGAPWESGHNAKTRANLIRSIVWYLDHFEANPVVPVRLANGPAVEQSFTFEVDNGILFAGHLDSIVEYGGEAYVMDQKTTGSTITPRWFEQFKPNTQMSMYTLAGKMILNSPVKGVIIDGAQIAVGFTRFERGFTFRTELELEEWYDSAMYHIEAAQRATRERHFPMNPSACGNYGGCEFRAICGRDPSVRSKFLAGDFIKGKRLDPLEQR